MFEYDASLFYPVTHDGIQRILEGIAIFSKEVTAYILSL